MVILDRSRGHVQGHVHGQGQGLGHGLGLCQGQGQGQGLGHGREVKNLKEKYWEDLNGKNNS